MHKISSLTNIFLDLKINTQHKVFFCDKNIPISMFCVGLSLKTYRLVLL